MHEKSSKQIFSNLYATGKSLWDTDKPDSGLISILEKYNIKPCKVLECGCGTGNDSIYLAEQGFTVTGIDFAQYAIDSSNAKKEERKLINVEFILDNFITRDLGTEQYDFAYDRSAAYSGIYSNVCSKFANKISNALVSKGYWFTIIHSTHDGITYIPSITEKGLRFSVEKYFDILELEEVPLEINLKDTSMLFWRCFMRKKI